MKITAGKQILVKFCELAALTCGFAQNLKLLLAAIDPHHLVRLDELNFVLNPIDDGFVLRQMFHCD